MHLVASIHNVLELNLFSQNLGLEFGLGLELAHTNYATQAVSLQTMKCKPGEKSVDQNIKFICYSHN